MTFPIPTAEAKKLGLPGSDVYRHSAFIYFDDHHRHWAAIRLNIEAVKAFSDTIVIAQRKTLAAHQVELASWMAKGALAAGLAPPWNEAWHDEMEYMNYEHLKLACGFELHLKARLISRGFVVHRIAQDESAFKALAKRQEKAPVLISDLLAVRGFEFDGKNNFLPGIEEVSLKFSWLTDRPGYRLASGLSDTELDVIRDYRTLRNQIHLPGDLPHTPALHALGQPRIEFLLPFINREIVEWSNKVSSDRGMRFRRLPAFD